MMFIIALIMIIVFLYVVMRDKMQIFVSLTVVSFIFGIIVTLLTDTSFVELFDWIFAGIFFYENPATGTIENGVITASMLAMFTVLFFDTLLEAGFFDKAIIYFVRKAKGDPFKIVMGAFAVSTVISISGDVTTTVVVGLALFLVLFKRMGMNLGYLSLIIVGPVIILNLLPWGGPPLSASVVTGVGLNELSWNMLPMLIVGYIYILGVVIHLGRKERKRLDYNYSEDSEAEEDKIDEIVRGLTENNAENKRYENNWINLILLIVSIILLFTDFVHGSVVFVLATALALFINYRTPEETTRILELIAPDAILPALGSISAGVFSGILTYSGMATSLANMFTQLIPESFGGVILPIYTVLTALFLIILPTDAYFFGITRVLNQAFSSYGIKPMETAVSSLIGESWAIMSPTIAAIHILIADTEQTLGDYMKVYLRYYGPLLLIWMFMFFALYP